MKILIVCQFYYPENFTIYKIAEQLVANGNSVDVLTGKPNYGYGHILEEYKNISEQVINGVNIHRVNLYPRKKNRISVIKNYLSFWNNSKKWVRHCKTKYDVVYTMSLSPVIMCCAGNLYKKIYNVPHIIHCVDLWPESVLVTKAVKEKSLVYTLLYKWSKSIYTKADKILIGSPGFAEYFDKCLKISTENLYYVPQCSLIEDNDVPEYKYGDGTHILYCGNLGLVQMIPLIIQTMKLIDDPKVFFHIIGMGPMTDYLVSSIKQCGLENNVIYHGPIAAKNAAAYFKDADAIYISLKNDGYVGRTIPNKVMMAMALGKPILGVLDGDGKKVMEEAGGCLVASPNPSSIRTAIRALSNMNEDAKKKMGLLNKAYYAENFSCEHIVKEIQKYLK